NFPVAHFNLVLQGSDSCRVRIVLELDFVFQDVIARPLLVPELACRCELLRRKLLAQFVPHLPCDTADGQQQQDGEKPDPAPVRSRARRRGTHRRPRSANVSGNSALAMTTTPCSVSVKPRRRSCSASSPMVVPCGIFTSLSMIARRMRQWRPTSTPSNRIEFSTTAKLLTRPFGDRMLRRTWPALTVATWHTNVSCASPPRAA